MAASHSADIPRPRGLLVLALAYAGFVALGMVNSLVGVAWPSIRDTFSLPLDALGGFLVASTAGYMLASAASGWLLALLNTGSLLAWCCALTGLALLGIGGAPAWAVLVALGFASGLGGGVFDGGMNAYAATHFSPRAINWLHACFGVGATLGPATMTAVISGGLSWRAGYALVGLIQLALALALGLARRLWDHPTSTTIHQQATRAAPLTATLRLPLAWLGIALFAFNTGIGVTLGNWLYSLLTLSRGVSPAMAGLWVTLFWGSLTVGRILFGVVAGRIAPTTLLRWCVAASVLGALLIWLNVAPQLTFGGIALLGLALAPQFPLLIAAAPSYLGAEHVNNGVGMQVAAASLGAAVLPSLLGLLARSSGLEVLGPFLFVAALMMVGLFELLARRLPHSADGTPGLQ